MDTGDPQGKAMIPLALALTCSAAAWLVISTLRPADGLAEARLASLRAPSKPRSASPAAKVSLLGRCLGFWGSMRPASHPRIKRALAEAGMEAVDPAVVAGWQFAGAAVGMFLGLGAGVGAVLAAPIFAFGGYRSPELYLSMRARVRRDESAAALPDAVDLLVVCTQAGLNLSLSLERVAENTPGLLGDELRRVVEEIALGVPRGGALASLAERNQSEEVSSLVGTLANADRFGTGVASALEGFAREMRQVRRRRAEEQARRAPVKILFPMVFLILPAFLVLTVLPVVLGTLRSIGF